MSSSAIESSHSTCLRSADTWVCQGVVSAALHGVRKKVLEYLPELAGITFDGRERLDREVGVLHDRVSLCSNSLLTATGNLTVLHREAVFSRAASNSLTSVRTGMENIELFYRS